ncbi:FAD/NAD(P)-binding protein [Sphingomonas sp. ASV193]|uniref:FAD/NAD(P)-binding protein n=1 Tax=Sphingomonas sp. ASV193 TaxID=3144405 RepID=UPI0032E8F874
MWVALLVDVIVIGGGFSGTMVAARLAARGVESVIVEAGRAGRGVAYGTDDPAHLLNVRAGRMSAWPEAPGDFAAFSHEEPDGFARRIDYGDYLAAILGEAIASGRVGLVEGVAVGAEPGEDWAVTLADGRALRGRMLLLASGNGAPAPLGIDGAIEDPWNADGRAGIAEAADSDAAVLVVGSGLTMVDVVLSLRRMGHRGPIAAVSRRGLLPRAHGAPFPPVPIAAGEVPRGLLATMRWVRARAAASGNWRAVVEGLRPHTQAIWQSWSEAEQRRFLRHARPWWDVHRHRLAPAVAAEVKAATGERQFEVMAGRLVAIAGGVAKIARRDGRNVERRADVVINATGPRVADDPLSRALLAAGIARRDPLGLGLAVEADDRLAGRDDAWAVGPPTRGRWWEIGAVPDIRVQAARVADGIAARLGR